MGDMGKFYSDHLLHSQIGRIIRVHSENKRNILDIVRDSIHWPGIKRVLDLGCGYGWFEEGLRNSTDLIVGIDSLDENEQPFLHAAKKNTRQAIYLKSVLPGEIDFPSGHFDLIVSIYSLYFFPGVLPEVRRLLSCGGMFIAITHSESMLEETEAYFRFENLRQIIRGFSAQNGEALLKQYFERVISVDYPNSLVFLKNEEEDLVRYIDFKHDFISKDIDPEILKKILLNELAGKGRLRLNKDDRIFLVKG